MLNFVEQDFEAVALKALDHVQFGFQFKPLSVNEAYVPISKGYSRPDLILSDEGRKYKKMITDSLYNQKKLQEWEFMKRQFSLWIIVDERCKIDIDNCHKLVQDAFVAAGVVPDDKQARDCRQMYCNFSKSKRVASSTKFAVLVRWGKPIGGQDELLF